MSGIPGRTLQILVDAASLRWQDEAACGEIGYELFFPGRGQEQDAAKAKAVCAGCPVISPCLEYALEQEARPDTIGRHGVFGGTTPAERDLIVIARRRAA
jgi:WhiB family transcriptional regulator, redox-sensing transcriptional regulator